MNKNWPIGIFTLSIFCASTVLSHECDDGDEDAARFIASSKNTAKHLCGSDSTFLSFSVGSSYSSDTSDSSADNGVEEVIVTGEKLNQNVLHVMRSMTTRESMPKTPPLMEGMEEIVVTAEKRSDCTKSELNSTAGNPTSATTGYKSLFERDYVGGDRLLSFIRRYDGSRINNISALGRGWVTPLFGLFNTMPYIFTDNQPGYDDAWDDWEILSIGDSLAAYSFLVKFDEDIQIAHRPFYLNDAELKYVDDHFELTHKNGEKSLFHQVDSARTNLEYRITKTQERDGSYISYVYSSSAETKPIVINHSADYQLILSYGTVDGHKVLTKATAPGNREWKYQYDNNARLISVYDPLGYRDKYDYDARSRITKAYSKKGDIIGQWTYDNQNRTLTSSKNNGSELVTFSYSTGGVGTFRETAVIDEFGRRTTYLTGFYKNRPFLMEKNGHSADCPNNEIRVDYYANTGFLKEVTNGLGEKTSFEYDDDERVKKVTVAPNLDSDLPTPTLVRDNEYDDYYPFITKSTFKSGEEAILEVSYDYCLDTNDTCRYALPRAVEKKDLINNVVQLTNYTYTLHSNGVVKNVLESGTHKAREIKFNNAGRATEYRSNGRLVRKITGYTADSRITSQHFPGLYTETFDYDDRGQITKHTRAGSGSTLETTYTYDEDGLVSGIESNNDIAKVGSELFYNPNGQLTQIRQTAPLPPQPPGPPNCQFPCFEEL
jgi:YD repeat-containing protein